MVESGFFNNPFFKAFNRRPTMDEFLALSKRFGRFGLSQDDIRDAIKSACDFFNIPQPRIIQDLTNQPGGQTMFVNWDRGSYYDDVLCFNMQQLIDMKVDSKEAFSLVMTHECAHRYFQGYTFPGLNNGQWEQELACDFCMGARAALEHMSIEKVVRGLGGTQGADTHPDGDLRAEAITGGYNVMLYLLQNNMTPSVENCIRGFNDFRATYEPTIFAREQRYI